MADRPSTTEWRWGQIALTAAMGIYPAIMGARRDSIALLTFFVVGQGLAFWLYTRRDVPHIPTGAQIFICLCTTAFVSLVGYAIGSLFA